jgi:DNA replication protein DnaC
LVILDEFGQLPFSQSGGDLLFHLLSELNEHTSVMTATNLAFAEWSKLPYLHCNVLLTHTND